MPSNPPPISPVPAGQPAPGSSPSSEPRKKRANCLLYGCGAVFAFAIIIAATVAITIWWIRRPIKPVVLSPKEKAVVEAKLHRIENSEPAESSKAGRTTSSTPFPTNAWADLKKEPDRVYIPGTNALVITERELNGLLNANTDLGQHVRLELGRDAINAYIAVPIPKDFPVGGGSTFRARGRFRVSIGNGGEPFAVLEDVTVFGVSLPKAWLGGIKGENLLEEAAGDRNGKPVLRGIKSLRVEPGALILRLDD